MRSFADILVEERTTVGTWNQIAAPELTDIIGWNGFDYAIVDCEHGPFGIEAAERQARACLAAGLAPVIRVPGNDPIWISRALDVGYTHIVVPSLETAEEAARAVAATRYAPLGTRGACPCVRATGHFTTDWPAHEARTARQVGIIALVETAEGVANAAGIAGTEGVAAVMPGPFDLAVSMGRRGDWRAAEVEAALLVVAEAALDAGKPLIVPVFSPDPAETRDIVSRWIERGARSVVLGSDKIIFAEAVARWRGALDGATAVRTVAPRDALTAPGR